MATKDELQAVWRMLCAAFPERSDNRRLPEMAGVYALALADLGGEVLNAAALDCVGRCKFFPTVAELRDSAANIITGRRQAQPALEAWGAVKQAVALYGRDGWARAETALPETAARTIAALGWRSFCDSDVDDEPAWRARFVELYSDYGRREHDAALTLPAVKQATAAQLETRQAVKELAAKLSTPRRLEGENAHA